MSLRLKGITLRAGHRPSEPSLSTALSHLVVIVGPNNSGKSLTLREIADRCSVDNVPTETVAVAELGIEWPDVGDAIQLYEALLTVTQPGEAHHGDRLVPLPLSVSSTSPRWIQRDGFLNEYENRSGYEHSRKEALLAPRTALLRATDRPQLAADQGIGDLQLPPATPLAALLADNELRERAREVIHDALGMWLVLDSTQPGTVRARLSMERPTDEVLERGFTQAAVDFHAGKPRVIEQSDGTQSFIGLVIAAIAAPHSVLLVDEADAFLHPPLARRLGQALASVTRQRQGTLIATTHSAAFLMGCLEASTDITVLRLTYEPVTRAATARALSPGRIRPLMRDPLLRSTRALDGLFHRAVVVTEADADRAFYDEINRRLQEVGRGVSDAQFVNAQNWQTEARIIQPLREAGIPAAAIMDLDAIAYGKDGEWRRLYATTDLDHSRVQELEAMRQDAAALLLQTGKEFQVKGLALFTGADLAKLEKAVGAFADVGFFLVPVGALESWLPELGARPAKREWIVDILDRLGDDPEDSDYVRPQTDNVWQFVDGVARWCLDPGRAGVP